MALILQQHYQPSTPYTSSRQVFPSLPLPPSPPPLPPSGGVLLQ